MPVVSLLPKRRAFTIDLTIDSIGSRRAAFPKLQGNFVNRSLRQFVGLCQPEFLTILVEQGAFPAHHFLIANLNKSVHLLRGRTQPLGSSDVSMTADI
jgi:hypothetical protein